MPRLLLLVFFLLWSTTIQAQSVQEIFHNKEGKYKVAILKNWKVKQEDVVTMIYAPSEGPDDSWKEYIDISVAPSNDFTLDESFAYYISQDFPGYYKNFKIIRQGQEVIDNAKAKWALFSFSGSPDDKGKSATLYNIFYLIFKDNTLYFLNAIAEASHYPKFENQFLATFRSLELP